MTFSGDLADINLADVFQNIQGNRLTGTLIVSAGGGKRYIYFGEGLVAGYSIGVNRGLPIGDHLVQRQYVTHADLSKALKRKARQKGSLREALVAMHLIEEGQFRDAAAELVQEYLYDLLSLKQAQFVFQDGKPPPRVFDSEQKAAGIAVDPGVILMEGARREDEISRISQVVTTDLDIFVMVEDWEDYELTEIQVEVAEFLDGHTDVKSILNALPHSRFEILKTVNDLVRLDLARPLSGREVDDLVQEAVADGNLDEAVILLNRALVIERSNGALRLQLVELLERMERAEEAATELAVLGYQMEQKGELDDALDYYERAACLKPTDVGIQEKRLGLLQSRGVEVYLPALTDYVEQLVEAGLAEKARTVIAAARDGIDGDDLRALERMRAKVEAHLGNYDVASEIYVGVARQLSASEDDTKLELLLLAHDLVPGDESLEKEIEDLTSGRVRRRRRRIRRVAFGAAISAVLAAVCTIGVVEMIVSHEVIHSLQRRIDKVVGGQPAAALADLSHIEKSYHFTFAGRRAGELERRLFDLQVVLFERMLARGETRAGLEGLQDLHAAVHRSDRSQRLQALIERARMELRAEDLFSRINTPGPDDVACAEFVELTSPQLLDFHLDRLERGEGVYPRARQSLLRVLAGMDSPRSIPVVAKTFLTAEDPVVRGLAAEILGRARQHREAGREQSWAAIYPELERAKVDPVTADRAAQALEWLRGDR